MLLFLVIFPLPDSYTPQLHCSWEDQTPVFWEKTTPSLVSSN